MSFCLQRLKFFFFLYSRLPVHLAKTRYRTALLFLRITFYSSILSLLGSFIRFFLLFESRAKGINRFCCVVRVALFQCEFFFHNRYVKPFFFVKKHENGFKVFRARARGTFKLKCGWGGCAVSCQKLGSA